jgi:cyclopropane fatty-acyl-phospholipid synthase-like methyltransferase
MSRTAPVSAPPSARDAAYTTSRSDVAGLVPPQAMRVLDVGCSNGALGRALAQAQPGRSVCGIEYDAVFAEEARADFELVITADLNLLDWQAAFGERRFDCIVFADVLEHLADPARTLRQARAHLLPGGTVVMSVPNIRHISALAAIFFGGRFPRRDRGIFDRTHLRWFTIADARSLLEENGFAVREMGVALRWGDRGGGRMNRLLNRLPDALQHWGPVRELLTYQVSMRADARP